MTVSLYIYIVSLVCIREREREKERISLLVNIFVQSSLCSLIQARGTMCVCERERERCGEGDGDSTSIFAAALFSHCSKRKDDCAHFVWSFA